MTDSVRREKTLVHFDTLPFDPEAVGKADPEKILKIREAEQAHRFRSIVFYVMLGFFCIVSLTWCVLMFRAWPPVDAGMPAFALVGAKIALITAVLLTIAISLMRFAIRCAHHENKDNDEELPNPSNSWEEVVKAFLKNIKLPTGS